ncbi:glutathione-disulfide reductase [Aureimonas jatrophae]|uniref:Glutathione reductase n=1 Tax=Aureimonas jatrophae TaxID=1166073 RepID=A0A1H0GH06_9HYPH|nr:glutathione-disulfide reductase [Aureimonas jatrophae]MBB3949568.1 glutathione reductase (NADPH) [Aureimonas jatrophae]SDO06215.1 NADPH-glutathione reductase [Aureimonas jatrophae]
MASSEYDYDFFVIGGGSGGVRAARRAAALGLRVGITEEYRYGGTCVIRGCVPKKIMVYASRFSEEFEDASSFGWSVGETRFDWSALIAAKDKEIARLESIYRANLEKAGAEVLEGRAVLEGANRVRLLAQDRVVTAERILLAVGGRADAFATMPGAEHCITSNEAFHLEALPQDIAILGGGYIAVEFANIFHGLGSKVTLVMRGDKLLKGFEEDLRTELQEQMIAKGITVRTSDTFTAVTMAENGRMAVALQSGEQLIVDQAMLAVGRKPNTIDLGCDQAGVELDDKGAIRIDDYSRTTASGVFAIGDCTDRLQLTPVAIHEAMCLIDTEFMNRPTKPDLDFVPTAVFSQPELGTVGLTEAEAIKRFGDIDVFRARFKPLKHTVTGREERTLMKLVVAADGGRVVGAHVLGGDAGELAQILGICVKAELTKDAFDRTMAVHPTAAEELVTLYEPSYRIRGGQRVEG